MTNGFITAILSEKMDLLKPHKQKNRWKMGLLQQYLAEKSCRRVDPRKLSDNARRNKIAHTQDYFAM